MASGKQQLLLVDLGSTNSFYFLKTSSYMWNLTSAAGEKSYFRKYSVRNSTLLPKILISWACTGLWTRDTILLP